jgi:hypothetical protein
MCGKFLPALRRTRCTRQYQTIRWEPLIRFSTNVAITSSAIWHVRRWEQSCAVVQSRGGMALRSADGAGPANG